MTDASRIGGATAVDFVVDTAAEPQRWHGRCCCYCVLACGGKARAKPCRAYTSYPPSPYLPCTALGAHACREGCCGAPGAMMSSGRVLDRVGSARYLENLCSIENGSEITGPMFCFLKKPAGGGGGPAMHRLVLGFSTPSPPNWLKLWEACFAYRSIFELIANGSMLRRHPKSQICY